MVTNVMSGPENVNTNPYNTERLPSNTRKIFLTVYITAQVLGEERLFLEMLGQLLLR